MYNNENWKEELEEGMAEMEESLREYREIKQETEEGVAEMKESLRQIAENKLEQK